MHIFSHHPAGFRGTKEANLSAASSEGQCTLAVGKEQHTGVSENGVPLNPMVLLIIITIKWLFHWEY